MDTATEEILPRMGVLAALAKGFDLVTRNPWILILPIIIDLFLWLGPRMSSASLLSDLFNRADLPEAAAEWAAQTRELAGALNLFGTVSLPVIGVPALMSGYIPENVPLPSSVIEIGTAGEWIGTVAALAVAGLMLAAIYYFFISLAARGYKSRTLGLGRSLLTASVIWFRLGLFVLIMLVIFALVLLPAMTLLLLISPSGNMIAYALLASLMALVATFFVYSPHAIAMYGRPVLKAMGESLQLVLRNMLQTVNLFLLVVVIGQVTASLWLLADDGSWLTGISVIGHAYVRSSLAAATFIFYRYIFVELQLAKRVSDGENES